AIDRIKDVGPWYKVDRSTLVFSNKDAMTTGVGPEAPIDSDEYGHRPTSSGYWTGTGEDGAFALDGTCDDWKSDDAASTGAMGVPDPASSWTDEDAASCDQLLSLLCIEQ